MDQMIVLLNLPAMPAVYAFRCQQNGQKFIVNRLRCNGGDPDCFDGSDE